MLLRRKLSVKAETQTMEHYEGEDSNHSVNGWIKKEIEDSDYEDYIKQEQEEESGDRYEELMGLTKEDLVARILQQEEDIRYLQDIRNGLEKNVQELATTCSQFKSLLHDMASAVSSLKGQQPSASSSSAMSTSRSTSTSSASVAAPTVTRPVASASTAQASPRSTPTAFTATVASPRPSPSVATTAGTRSVASTTVPPSHMSNSSVVTTDRVHHGGASLSGHSTVTITRSTNVVIKTEIPSPPPPQQHTIVNPVMSSASVMVANPRSRAEPQPSYQTRQQQQQQQQHSAASNFAPSASHMRSANQMGNVNASNFPSQQQRSRVNPSMQFSNAPAAPAMGRSVNQMTRTSMPVSFQGQRQTMQNAATSAATPFPAGRGAKTRAHIARQQEMLYSSSMSKPSPVITPSNPTVMIGRVRATNHPNVSAVPSPSPSAVPSKLSVTEITENIPVKMPSGITLPSGLTLSIVTPKASADPKSEQPVVEKSASSPASVSRVVSCESSGRPTGVEENNAMSKSSADNKCVSSAGGTITTQTAASAVLAATVANYEMEEEEDEEEEYFDEIAVLIPDKKGSPSSENSGTPSGTDGSTPVNNAEAYSQSPAVSEAYWTSQNTTGSKAESKSAHAFYQNNDEYMFEEPEDIDSDENDAKIYLGEDVSLPKELVDSCIKQGPNPAKLTRNLMKALFPDPRELASGYLGDSNKPTHPSLPGNKVKAIIAQVQKVFPHCKRSVIIFAMNAKCKEARQLLGKNTNIAAHRGRVHYTPY